MDERPVTGDPRSVTSGVPSHAPDLRLVTEQEVVVSTHGVHRGPMARVPPPEGGGHEPQNGPGLGDRAAQAANVVGRHVKTPETKEFFKTSEFVVWGLTVLAILTAGAVIGDNGGADDNLKAGLVWTLVAATSIGYIVSRGISKAGARRGYGEAPMGQGPDGAGD